jgi:hypothetical protein
MKRYNDPMNPFLLDQQPTMKTIGRRRLPPLGLPPGPEARAAWNALAAYRTRVPKGIFIYSSHADMERDREYWTVQAVLERAARQRA